MIGMYVYTSYMKVNSVRKQKPPHLGIWPGVNGLQVVHDQTLLQ